MVHLFCYIRHDKNGFWGYTDSVCHKKEATADRKKVCMRQLPKPGEIYKHFKGNCYRIITVAEHTETGEKLVVYQALYGDFNVYARELSMFMGPVDKEKYPYATQKRRFELVESGAVSPVMQGAAGAQSVQSREDAGKNGQMGNGEIPASSERLKEAGGTGGNEKTEVSDEKQSPEKETEPGIDPMVLAYLDADTCKEKLQILTTMKDRLTDEMINTMAIAIDVEVKPGDITERYEELKYCLATRERFECRRLR